MAGVSKDHRAFEGEAGGVDQGSKLVWSSQGKPSSSNTEAYSRCPYQAVAFGGTIQPVREEGIARHEHASKDLLLRCYCCLCN